MERVFLELTIIICLASGLSVLFRFLKQPAVLAYILTGILIGPLGLFHIEGTEVFHTFGQIGVTLLLFMLGLELRLNELRMVGKVAAITGILQIVVTSTLGFSICLLLGFSPIASLYMGIALTFSSTIIIVKLLSDKKDLHSLYGKIAVGILLVQDFVAIIALILLSGFQTKTGVTPVSFLLIMVKAVSLFAWAVFISRALLPKLISKISRSSEILFLFSLGWAFGVAALISSPAIGFSIEIGGFLAGLALANSTENFQIASKVKSLRDFFITIFFVSLGTSLVFDNFLQVVLPAVILSAFVLIGNPIILSIILGMLGYRKRTSFLVGLTVAQISEFSMIVIFMGNKLGHVPDDAVSLITLAGTITFVLSTYMILNGNKLFKILSPYISFLERKQTHEQRIENEEMKGHVIIVGADQMGQSIVNALEEEGEKVVIVDFDPDIVTLMQKQGQTVYFGDITDIEIQEKAQLEKAKMVISTIPDVEDNLLLIESMNHANKRAKVVVMAFETEDAKALYKAGADYVIMPHLAGGRHLAKILIDKNHLELIERYKAKDLAFMG